MFGAGAVFCHTAATLLSHYAAQGVPLALAQHYE